MKILKKNSISNLFIYFLNIVSNYEHLNLALKIAWVLRKNRKVKIKCYTFKIFSDSFRVICGRGKEVF